MVEKRKAAGKAKPRSAAAKSAKTSRSAHKKPAVRKSPVKHTAKTTRASARSGDFTKYSGKFTVRVPKSLHQALVERAEKEGVSLNLFVTNALSRIVAMHSKGKK